MWGNTAKMLKGFKVTTTEMTNLIQDDEDNILFRFGHDRTSNYIYHGDCLLYSQKADWAFIPYNDKDNPLPIGAYIYTSNSKDSTIFSVGTSYNVNNELFAIDLTLINNVLASNNSSRVMFYSAL